ncbi:Sucrose-phosphatase, C-terminal, partial [Dillenia turbinata]
DILKKYHPGSMDRLDSSASLMVVSDLDNTMVDHEDPENLSLFRFNALWEAYYRVHSLLVYSTGRSPMSYKQLRKEKPLLTPDITIMSVGTEITYGESMVPDDCWQKYLNQNWDRSIITKETAKFPELVPQPEIDQRPHKVSFFIKNVYALGVMKTLSECLERQGLDVKIIYSSGIALDILPQGAGKGQALEYLLKKLKAEGKVPCNTLVCGDSGNDADLFAVPDVYGVMVSNAQQELLKWQAQNGKNNPNIILATERCAAGIIQAIGNFSLGPNISPRDTKDLLERKMETINTSNSMVRFYLFYERWRRGEVDKSEHYIKNLQLVCHPSGVFVHASGVEGSLQQLIDAMVSSYGDMQGKQFRVWLDRLSTAQIGPDTFLVKFNKWEMAGERPRCCLTTVLLNLNAKFPCGFKIFHMHQTWFGEFGVEDKSSWLF